ncbi:AAA family ATPase [Treponema brennaborense]|uniref:Nitrogenase n=1 Tax=Treponema brennaborense (strain DSM 12168 / CIP 105900 / DD5/3) TaxID=906968 RepID=F4LLI6_TREBD|nr:nitrogenase iron protein NifH [Treponema brennaborense]AEE16650.1 Nitrogenase [Treponema brennaborense DSM 12168]
MIKIAIYGKGGIGKSTTTANLSAALSGMGYTVMQIGCDPKADSVKTLMGGVKIPSVLDRLRGVCDSGGCGSKWGGSDFGGAGIKLEDIVFKGFNGVLCVEAGGPTPGIGCAGRGIITAFEKLEELGAYETYRPDIVLYDVLGDVVCGGFAMPIRNGYADHVFIVTSGEMMSLYAAGNIASAVRNFGARGYASYSGVILNARNVENEREIVERALLEIGGSIVSEIPRSGTVQEAELQGKTVIEACPDSEQAERYRELARRILKLTGAEAPCETVCGSPCERTASVADAAVIAEGRYV